MEINTAFPQIKISTLKLFALALFFCVFQFLIILQRPFIQIDFVKSFYLSMGFVFLIHFIFYILKSKDNLILYALDIFAFLYLLKSQPYFSSFYLVVLLVFLFLAGLELSRFKSLGLTIMTSVGLSLINALYLKWTGMQNILTLTLFNLAFFSAGAISNQLKMELASLTEDLSQTQRKLKSKEELSQILMNHMPAGLLAVFQQKEIIFSNPTLQNKLFLDGNSALELVQQSKANHISEVQFYNKALADKRFYEVDTTRYFDNEYANDIDVYLIKDTTEVKNLQDQMKQKEKLAAVGQLAAGIAHEIRNPLAGISGSIELLSQERNSPDDQKLMRIILKEIDRLNNLITEFLDYSKPEKRPDQKVDIAFILDEVVQNIKLSPSTPSHVKFSTQISSNKVWGFADKLKQAFLNIIMNAVQACKDQAEANVNILMETNENQVMVVISDSGTGMSEEVQKRIFEPFFTTKSKGTGLGLALTHKILESHNAEIKIVSTLGKGTTFRIIFSKA